MANRKPTPKTQRDISSGLQTPFDTARGNPNARVSSNENRNWNRF